MLLIAPSCTRQPCVLARRILVFRRANPALLPRRDSLLRRAVFCPVSRRPKRIASRTCASACDVRDVCAWTGACRRHARTHLSYFLWDMGQ